MFLDKRTPAESQHESIPRWLMRNRRDPARSEKLPGETAFERSLKGNPPAPPIRTTGYESGNNGIKYEQ